MRGEQIMKLFYKNIKIEILIVFVITLISGFVAAQDQIIELKRNHSSTSEFDLSEYFQYFQKAFPIGLDASQSCTIIYASDGKIALAGNNEDYTNPFPIIWFQPAKDGKFGYMCFGFQSG
jgi:hypothetical protein